MIKTILFDLGKVLVDFSHERMFTQLGDLVSWSGTRMRQVLLEEGWLRDFECGRLSEEEFRRCIEGRTGVAVDSDALYRAGCDIFSPIPGIPALLEEVGRAGYRKVVISNICVSHYQFVREHFDVLDSMNDFVLSFEVGAVKPDPPIYRAAIEKIGCAPHECLYVDDIPENVAAGQRFGLVGTVFTGVEAFAQWLGDHGVRLAGHGATSPGAV